MNNEPRKPRAEPPPDQLDDSWIHDILGYQLARATLVTTASYARHVGEVFDLRPVEFTILAMISGTPGVSARAIAQALGVTPANVSMWLDRLEQRGFVERERSEADRRAQHIRASAEGQALSLRAIEQAKAGENDALSTLSNAERAMLIELLGKVAARRSPD